MESCAKPTHQSSLRPPRSRPAAPVITGSRLWEAVTLWIWEQISECNSWATSWWCSSESEIHRHCRAVGGYLHNSVIDKVFLKGTENTNHKVKRKSYSIQLKTFENQTTSFASDEKQNHRMRKDTSDTHSPQRTHTYQI